MYTEKEIIQKITDSRPTLSDEKRMHIWNTVASNLKTAQPTVSPYLFTRKNHKIMTPIVLLLIAILGGGTTALASNAARPGDLLFPIDRSIEDLRIKFAGSEESKSILTEKFTNERIQELHEIINEETTVLPSNLTEKTFTSTSTNTLHLDATIFADTTVIRVQLDDTIFYFESTAQSRADLITSIKTQFPTLHEAQIENILTITEKDRTSLPQDMGIVTLSDSGNTRVRNAIQELLTFIEKSHTSKIAHEDIVNLLSGENATNTKSDRVRHENGSTKIGDTDSDYEVTVTENGESDIEVRTEKTRVKIEEKDGKIEVRTEIKEIPKDIPVQLSFVAHAKIFSDTTIVQLDFDGQTVYVETNSTNRNGIIDAVQKRFTALTKVQIDSLLTLEVINRTSIPEDMGLPSQAPFNDSIQKKYDDDDEYENERNEDEREKDEDEEEEKDDGDRE